MSSDGSYVAAAAGGSLVFFNSEESEKKVLKDAHSLIPDELGSSETYITEKETVTTKERKIPVFVSKTLPSKCPSCDAPFNGKSGDACDYCGAVIKTEERVKKME